MIEPGLHPAHRALPELEELLDLRFADGDRVVVPVLGSGLNLQAAREVGSQAVNWEQLLRDIEGDEGITWPSGPPRSMTGRWEGLLQRQHQRQASEREEELAGLVADALDDQTDLIWEAARGSAPPLYRRLLSAGFRDLMTLNFDDRLARSSAEARLFKPGSPAGQRLRREARFGVLRQLYQRWHLRGPGFTRVWQPHGRTDAPATILLGVARYGRSIESLDLAWQRFKSAERDFSRGRRRDRDLFDQPTPRRLWSRPQRDAWLELRRAPGPWTLRGKPTSRAVYRRPFDALSWLDVFMISPLLFVGCGLGNDEFPLWWSLHQRARNQARLPPGQQQPAVVLTVREEGGGPDTSHLAGGPAGVSTVLFESWSALWGWLGSTGRDPDRGGATIE